MQQLSIFKRLVSETPAFWIRVQIVALILSAIVSYTYDAHLLPQPVFYVLAGLFGGVALIAQFAVKDVGIIQEVLADPAKILDHVAELRDQVNSIKVAVTSPQKTTIAEVLTQLPGEPVAQSNQPLQNDQPNESAVNK